jgi:hypothetical protein
LVIWERKKSNGRKSGLSKAAAIAAFRNAVFLLGVPRYRPPRRSPGNDPLGIATLLLSRFDQINEKLTALTYWFLGG